MLYIYPSCDCRLPALVTTLMAAVPMFLAFIGLAHLVSGALLFVRYHPVCITQVASLLGQRD